MNTKFEYYYNNVPGKGKCRNNLVYTSLISSDQKTFCKWYYNDTEYHHGQNQIVNPALMEEKWEREIKFYQIMHKYYPEHLLKIIDIDKNNKKIYYEIDGVDFWELSSCDKNNFNSVLKDWDLQMLEMFKSYKNLDLYKFSLHPSSYFIVNGKLKSINYFFTYDKFDSLVSISSVLSHISNDRKKLLFLQLKELEIDLYSYTPFVELQKLAFSSFEKDFPDGFINKALNEYTNTILK